MIVSGRYVRAVGWLHRDHPFPRGNTSEEFLDRLHEFATRWRDSTKALGWGTFRGQHGCEFCRGRAKMHGNLGVPAGCVLFVSPEMIAHYVGEHGYTPPAGFVTAVLAAPMPGSEEYKVAVQVFRARHLRAVAQRRRRRRPRCKLGF
jgi:hypothetical protein